MNVCRQVELFVSEIGRPFTVADICSGLNLTYKKANNAVSRLRQLNVIVAHSLVNPGVVGQTRVYEYDPLAQETTQDLDGCERAWAKLMQGKRFESFTIKG